MLRKKNITLNGKKAQGNEQLRQGDAVKLFLSDDTIGKFSETRTAGYAETELDILYEDKHTIFINKPAGMLSQKAAAEDVSLVEHLIAYLLKTGQISEERLPLSGRPCATGWIGIPAVSWLRESHWQLCSS